MTARISDAQYTMALDAFQGVARAVLIVADTFDPAELRTVCSQMEAVAPILEPTAYARGGGQNLADQAAFWRAVDEFVTALRRLDPTASAQQPGPTPERRRQLLREMTQDAVEAGGYGEPASAETRGEAP